MKAFISHSSVDKGIALAIYEALEPGTAWIDSAEIEWGDRFVWKIEQALSNMSDFVLLWSQASSQSSWVQFELDMALIQSFKEKAIRIRVITLDKTPVPLRLQPFHRISTHGVPDPVSAIVSELRRALAEPGIGTRHRFLNRNQELDRIETSINDPETRIVILHGFMGAGKTALAHEALRRFYHNPSTIDIAVSTGVGPVELGLRLHHDAFREILPEADIVNPYETIETSLREIASRGQFLLFRNVQHWLDDEGAPEEPLATVMRISARLPETVRKPILLTSTRYIRIPAEFVKEALGIHIGGLQDKHAASLISLWYEIIDGSTLESTDAARLAPEIHGHPFAAKLAAGLVSRFGVNHLLEYPRELVALRRDLAKALIRDINVSKSLLALMEVLAVIGTPVPSAVLAKALNLTPDSFHEVVAEATSCGLTNTSPSGQLTTHPLVADYFWRSHLDRDGYMERAKAAAVVLHEYFIEIPNDSVGKIDVLRKV